MGVTRSLLVIWRVAGSNWRTGRTYQVMWTGAAASNRLQLGLFRVIGIEYGSHHCVGITKIR
jgi:hypothetical protein